MNTFMLKGNACIFLPHLHLLYFTSPLSSILIRRFPPHCSLHSRQTFLRIWTEAGTQQGSWYQKSKHNCSLFLTTLPVISYNIQGREILKSITGISLLLQCIHGLYKVMCFNIFNSLAYSVCCDSNQYYWHKCFSFHIISDTYWKDTLSYEHDFEGMCWECLYLQVHPSQLTCWHIAI